MGVRFTAKIVRKPSQHYNSYYVTIPKSIITSLSLDEHHLAEVEIHQIIKKGKVVIVGVDE